jgi:hypothetical protein
MYPDKHSSEAFRSLSRCARLLLQEIEAEAARGNRQISYNEFQTRCAMPRSTIGFGLRQLCLLGFVEITPQGGRRHNSFQLMSAWQDISKIEARKLRRQAAWQRTATPAAPSAPLAMAVADG